MHLRFKLHKRIFISAGGWYSATLFCSSVLVRARPVSVANQVQVSRSASLLYALALGASALLGVSCSVVSTAQAAGDDAPHAIHYARTGDLDGLKRLCSMRTKGQIR
jgi:hypothetical protein